MQRRTAIVGALAAIFAAIQFVAPERTNPPVHSDLGAPPDVNDLLRRACFDCHSNETRWAWYSGVAPFSWLIVHDVGEGRRRLNFSEWADYASDPETEKHKLNQIIESLARGDMAPWYYGVLHPDGRLNRDQQTVITRWASQEANRTPP
ncbi:MAG TPA: heme-binding domain-containing protein [Candidatus Margulisiibacteriota bacterium]|nr:heme-binding domain-containing protein [Candidatus Margulisiibacteriota bacterium]